MRSFLILMALLAFLLPALPARADQEAPVSPLEYAPNEPVKCEWSKMNSEELKACKKRKDFFEKMSAEERQKYNDEVDKRRTVERIDRLDRRTR